MNIQEVFSGIAKALKLKPLSLETVVQAAVLVLVGLIVIRILMKLVDRMLERSKALNSLRIYIRSAIRVGLWFLLALMVAGSLGVDVTSIIALLSVAGLAVSLALQNTLSNLAGGIQLLLTRPFQVGDYVEADGVAGIISIIGLSNTTFTTYDNKQIYVPNSQLAASKVINYTALGKRRVDVSVNVSYHTPTQTVKGAIQQVLDTIPQILPDPAPVICLSAYQSSNIQFTIRAWATTDDYWDVYYAILERLRESFDQNGVEMTFDHLNVHIVEQQ